MVEVVAPLDELLGCPQILFDSNATVPFLPPFFPRANQRVDCSASAEEGAACDVAVLLPFVSSSALKQDSTEVVGFSRHCRVEVVFDDNICEERCLNGFGADIKVGIRELLTDGEVRGIAVMEDPGRNHPAAS